MRLRRATASRKKWSTAFHHTRLTCPSCRSQHAIRNMTLLVLLFSLYRRCLLSVQLNNSPTTRHMQTINKYHERQYFPISSVCMKTAKNFYNDASCSTASGSIFKRRSVLSRWHIRDLNPEVQLQTRGHLFLPTFPLTPAVEVVWFHRATNQPVQ